MKITQHPKTMKAHKNTKKGFTLMEMVFVVALIAIVGSLAYRSLHGELGKANNTKQQNLTRNIEDGKLHYSMNNTGVVGTTPTFAQLQSYIYVSGTLVGNISQIADPVLNKTNTPLTSWGTYPDPDGNGGTPIVWGTLGATAVSN